LKEIIDTYEIYSNKIHHPKKRAAKCSFCGKEVGNLLNIGKKSRKCRLESRIKPSVEFSV
jgi:hypothetical protein